MYFPYTDRLVTLAALKVSFCLSSTHLVGLGCINFVSCGLAGAIFAGVRRGDAVGPEVVGVGCISWRKPGDVGAFVGQFGGEVCIIGQSLDQFCVSFSKIYCEIADCVGQPCNCFPVCNC